MERRVFDLDRDFTGTARMRTYAMVVEYALAFCPGPPTGMSCNRRKSYMTTLAMTLAPARERAGARVAYKVVMAAAGALLMSVLAQVSIPLPFTPVPITGQTLGVLLVGASLGPSLGAASMLVYLLWGFVGLPVFAPEAGGGHLTGTAALGFASASAGYLWGFVFAASAVGVLAQRGWDRAMRSSISAMLLGEVVIYAFGLPWLMMAADVPFSKAAEWGLYPFIIGDTIKLFLAAGLLPLAWKVTKRGGADA